MSIEELKSRVRARVLRVTNAPNEAELPVGLTTAQAAVIVNRSKKTLLNWSSCGGPIQPMRDAHGHLCWPIDSVERFVMGEER